MECRFSAVLPVCGDLLGDRHILLCRPVCRLDRHSYGCCGPTLARARNDFRVCIRGHYGLSVHRGPQLDKCTDAHRPDARIDCRAVERGLRFGIDLILFLMVVMGGRIIPMFTANAVPGAKPLRFRWLERIALGSVLALLATDLLGPSTIATALAAGIAAVAHGARLALWQPWLTILLSALCPTVVFRGRRRLRRPLGYCVHSAGHQVLPDAIELARRWPQRLASLKVDPDIGRDRCGRHRVAGESAFRR